MKEEYQDRIDNYLLGRMSEAERVSFERDLNLDDKLKEQYEFTKAMKNALMMDVCTARNPKCGECGISNLCKYFNQK